MRPSDCPRCDYAAARSAVLLVQLRKAARELHRALGHETTHFADCREAPCRDHAAVAGGGTPRTT
jgi:hypothetical protein